MIEARTEELTGAALDWAVADAEGVAVEWEGRGLVSLVDERYDALHWQPSRNWWHCGPLMERHSFMIEPVFVGGYGNRRWRVFDNRDVCAEGASIPVAFCKAVVQKIHGDTVTIPGSKG